MSIDDDSLTIDWSDEPSKVREGQKEERTEERKPFRVKRNFSEDRPKRHYNDSDSRRYGVGRGRYSDRPRERKFRDNEEFSGRRKFRDGEERPRKHYSDSESYGYGKKYSDRPGRNYDEPESRFSRKRENGFNAEQNREFDNRNRRNSVSGTFRHDRHEDRPRRNFNSEKSEYKRPDGASVKHEKPYGFESFKPARNRNDSSDFFWNVDDVKSDK